MMQVGIFNPVGGSSRKELDIGSVLLTTNTKTPKQMGYVGEWHLIDEGVTFVSAGAEAGAILGTNTPVVPLPAHNHTGKTAKAGKHRHSSSTKYGGEGSGNGSAWGLQSGAWNGSMPTSEQPDHEHGLIINSAGTSNATLDVRGRHMKVFAWWRVG
ncbi:TPA: hypothetical protein AB5H75_003832 [Vibrio mimicus]|uniref:hypothetical protein n=1 Tax=Vibrio metoecus TaxID=1481663 RepID=UPI0001B99AF9|nr:hypothetical protein [Vibrio metoecus]EEX66995.1 hypothetical protein VCJ_000619 [Vibrio metoecus]EEX67329.1 hypothetical protein VCJ_000489 [Vibrio metoecus]